MEKSKEPEADGKHQEFLDLFRKILRRFQDDPSTVPELLDQLEAITNKDQTEEVEPEEG